MLAYLRGRDGWFYCGRSWVEGVGVVVGQGLGVGVGRACGGRGYGVELSVPTCEAHWKKIAHDPPTRW